MVYDIFCSSSEECQKSLKHEHSSYSVQGAGGEHGNSAEYGPILSDKSSTGKMRDVYAIGLFRLEHVISLLKAACVGEVLYLLPWTLIMRALLSARARSCISVRLLHNNYQIPTPLPEQGKHGIEVLHIKLITVIRAMITVLGFIFALRNVNFDIPLDRMSTHPLENFFGLPRRLVLLRITPPDPSLTAFFINRGYSLQRADVHYKSPTLITDRQLPLEIDNFHYKSLGCIPHHRLSLDLPSFQRTSPAFATNRRFFLANPS
jgi:hypothetical protein